VERVILDALTNQVGIVFGEADPPICPRPWLSVPLGLSTGEHVCGTDA
jgi:hypothetical protein